jgi:glycosyltransferase involved in cell wall biosynthesis
MLQADVVCLTLRRYCDWLIAHHTGARCLHIPIGLYRPAQPLAEPVEPRLLFFSTLAPYKGLETLLQAYRMLQPRFPGLSLTIAGAEHNRFPGYLAQLQQAHRDLPNVHWLGYVAEHEVSALFGASQVVVLPYAAATGSSSVLYQAMMCGRSVVASDLPELCAAVDESGLRAEFFRHEDATDLARALSHSLNSSQWRRMNTEHNLAALSRLRLDETSRAYLRAFQLAYRLRHFHSPVAQSVGITTETI